MKSTLKYIVGATWQPMLTKYLSRKRTYQFGDIVLQIPPSVFHPGFFFSTHLLLKQIKKLSLQGRKFLEPGAGSGLLSVYAARHGAMVTATDINPAAVEALRENSKENDVRLTVFESDLFERIPVETYDIVAINPPYYKKEPVSFADYAWNCGTNGEYFQKLFSHLPRYIHANTTILMVLCNGCDIQMVKTIAGAYGFEMQTISTKQNLLETNFIYGIHAT